MFDAAICAAGKRFLLVSEHEADQEKDARGAGPERIRGK
jgi:hypothetical protein